jgi:hypothetical protein
MLRMMGDRTIASVLDTPRTKYARKLFALAREHRRAEGVEIDDYWSKVAPPGTSAHILYADIHTAFLRDHEAWLLNGEDRDDHDG